MNKITVFAENVRNPEGPVALPDGSWVFTEMDLGIISRVNAHGNNKQKIAYTGRPNGLALDAVGNIWVAESKNPALLVVSQSGQVTEITRGSENIPFLWPNDLCFGPDGAIYMTDSGILLEEVESIIHPADIYDLNPDGKLFRINPSSGKCDLLDCGFQFTNGIAIGHGGTYLYVNETLTGNIYRYKFNNGSLGSRELFGNVMIKPSIEYGKVAGPDGMAFDNDGNLHVGVLTQGDITILNPDGGTKERIQLPGNFPTNIAFSTSDENYCLVTEGSGNQLLKIETSVEGLKLY